MEDRLELQLLLQEHTAKKIRIMYSQKSNCATLFPVSIFKNMWTIYIFPGSVHLFCCSQIGRPILGIYKDRSQIYECRNWDWGLAVFFLKNIFYQFSVQYLNSADRILWKLPVKIEGKKGFRKSQLHNLDTYRLELLIICVYEQFILYIKWQTVQTSDTEKKKQNRMNLGKYCIMYTEMYTSSRRDTNTVVF